jgi:hypothetical protein
MLRTLLAEFEAARALLERAPQQHLGETHLPAQLTRAFYRLYRGSKDVWAPSTMGR